VIVLMLAVLLMVVVVGLAQAFWFRTHINEAGRNAVESGADVYAHVCSTTPQNYSQGQVIGVVEQVWAADAGLHPAQVTAPVACSASPQSVTIKATVPFTWLAFSTLHLGVQETATARKEGTYG